MTDAFYTSNTTATQLVQSAASLNPHTIADFACGDGQLLFAAAERWPNARLIAIDINAKVYPELKANVNVDHFVVADFLRCETLTSLRASIDLVIINPPFSCKGGTKIYLSFKGENIGCSLAMAFILRSTEFLSQSGELLALLPSSCLTSHKDQHARDLLTSAFQLDVLDEPFLPKFKGCSVDVVSVRLIHRSIELSAPPSIGISALSDEFTIVRGKRPNPQTFGSLSVCAKSLVPFVHTTELHAGTVRTDRSIPLSTSDRIVRGPAILMPRVGRPKLGKLSLLDKGNSVAISDCVIAITAEDPRRVIKLYQLMCAAWPDIRQAYTGSCAKYLTLTRLKTIIATIDKDVTQSLPQVA